MGIEIKWNNFIPFKGYLAMTFFGKMWIRNSNKTLWDEYVKEGKDKIVTHHEMIHVKQAISTHNSWFRFYLLYIWYWIKGVFSFGGFKFAYKMNPFELEAYANEDVKDYIDIYSNGATRWKVYKEIPMKQRKKYWRQYWGMRIKISFSNYIKEYIDKNLNFDETLNYLSRR